MSFKIKPVSEKQFQAQVIRLARLMAWRVYHTHDSRHSASGFPDLVLVRGREPPLFVELKTDKGKLTADQQMWLDALLDAGADARVWRPGDWQEILDTLSVVPSS